MEGRMSSQVVVTLPDPILKSAASVARRSGRAVEEILAEAITTVLGPGEEPNEKPIESWTDEEVLAAARSIMDPSQDSRLGDLLKRQQDSALAPSEVTELTSLVRVYEHGLLRKADGVREAVRRKLIEQPSP
jgi:hypothetical protein